MNMKYVKIILLFIFLSISIKLDCSLGVVSNKLSNLILEQELVNKLEDNKTFKLALAKRESSLRPHVVNEIGAMGMWQFMPSTLKHLGFKGITPYKFKLNPSIFPVEVQEQALDKKFNSDIKELTKQWFRAEGTSINYLEDYVGQNIKGVRVSLAGLLAACHIGGIGGTIRFLDSQGSRNPSDINGTSILSYLKEFSDYDYHYEKPIKQKLQCLKKQSERGDILTLSSRISKSCLKEHILRSTEIVSTFVHTQHSIQNRNTHLSVNSSLWDLRHNYLNGIEQFWCSEAVPQLSTTYSLEILMERSSGIMLTSGKELYKLPEIHKEYLKIPEFSSFISNLFGMHLGILNYQTYFHYTGLRRLRHFPHLGQG